MLVIKNYLWWSFWLGLILACSIPTTHAAALDSIEFLSGAKLEGKVLSIDKQQRKVQFESMIAGNTRAGSYPYETIHRVLWKGKEYIVTPKPTQPTSTPKPGTSTVVNRSPSEIRNLIDTEGRSTPDWLASTPLNHPKTLDLNWPHPAPKPWNSGKNIGQYIWDRINPNARQWRSGLRLMYHLSSMHQTKGELRTRIQRSIGSMYFRFFQDYSRAAWWWEQAGPGAGNHDVIGLAECYFRLGSRDMAQQILGKSGNSVGKIKLLGAMGETKKALQLANSFTRYANQPHEALLVAGDICRATDQFEMAIEFYKKVLSAKPARNEQYSKRYRGRATDSIESIKLFELLDITQLANGTYTGSSLGYEAPLHVAATVQSGRIVKLEITQHREKQYYSALRDVPEQIIRKQDLKQVDATSRATITAIAIINATAKALTSDQQP
ncbi:MAG: FMN-binding protein [Verrucomicrobia bacterium]|jgi:uncharacterized protein with FMN-binding domain|nr:FMN-binding protein [Verrucomicrobiota bacterium]